ncbi:hypothetical protein BDF20DRAFT_812222 [Mycotypha africana]|uniref:uncharacterized protein n=1 Tax=Mycotypha africana TaxID=64632 RepID=UPI0023005DCA|nr:uncharacterized protein BDF20DRAFT_812222 [Mycotypha africana]KAI8990749.1 hypothetical protein BDF20DRAFT_812222 [Mycotypha africana]
MGWLPGKPKPCPCALDHTSRRHLIECHLVPSHLWLSLPSVPSVFRGNRIDYALCQLPLSSSAACPEFWVDLCSILWHFDKLCNPEGDYSTDPDPGRLWSDKSSPPLCLLPNDELLMNCTLWLRPSTATTF